MTRDAIPADRISVAPMMDWTDRHCRYFFRLLAPGVRLYTEMITAQAVLQGDRDRLLAFDPAEHPVALQLGGSDPRQLAAAVRVANDYGYDEFNLNIGCPSDRVRSGSFGACLMADPGRVGECVAAMRDSTAVPVTVKTRIGIDAHDEYSFLERFIDTVAEAGCERFIVHARKAILAGLSPKQNRSIPPLRYEYVYRLRRERPALQIILNGGIGSRSEVDAHLASVDGVMIGRKAYADPWFLHDITRDGNGMVGVPIRNRHDVVTAMAAYAQRHIEAGTRLHHITRHMLGLYSGVPGARRWRQYLCECARQPDADYRVLLESLSIFDIAA